jgi:cytochrome P450
LAKVVIEVAVQRRKDRITAADILGTVMQSRDRETDQPMSDAQLAKEILTIVIAGHETTASVLNWTWFLLSKHPHVEQRMSKEIRALAGEEFPVLDDFPKFRYTVQVIEEALRLYPPLWLMTRKAVKDDHLGEYFVPAGTEIYISPYLIQRHPAIWEVPDGFDPDRFGGGDLDDQHRLAMCPFGAGPRNCIGEFFARIEMQIHLMMMVKDLRLRYDETRPPEMVAGMNLLSRHDFVMAPEMKTDV